MNSLPESKKNHIWHKIIWQTDTDEHPLGPYHFAEVYCCEESNGYSIWYVRRLGKENHQGIEGMENGDYLLRYFSKADRDTALERAVLIANSDASPEQVIQTLDKLAMSAQKV